MVSSEECVRNSRLATTMPELRIRIKMAVGARDRTNQVGSHQRSFAGYRHRRCLRRGRADRRRKPETRPRIGPNCAVRPANMPVSTSPVPPVAMPGLPVEFMKVCAIGRRDYRLIAFQNYVRVPIRGGFSRDIEASGLDVFYFAVQESRAISPGCGVSAIGPVPIF